MALKISAGEEQGIGLFKIEPERKFGDCSGTIKKHILKVPVR